MSTSHIIDKVSDRVLSVYKLFICVYFLMPLWRIEEEAGVCTRDSFPIIVGTIKDSKRRFSTQEVSNIVLKRRDRH